jgi:ABC-2 type transport system ATP-binding protein
MSLLITTGLTKSFHEGTRQVKAVDGVSLTLERGEILAFLGPNGAGKTTTIKMIAGLVEPDSGAVLINGTRLDKNRSTYANVGAVFDGNLYKNMSALANLEYFGALKKMPVRAIRARASQLLEQFGLSHKANEQAQNLSKGMQQKLSIAVALMHRPGLLLLDEPTNGVDIEGGEGIKDLLRQLCAEGHGILLTTHQLDIAQELSDRVSIIKEGRIVAEAPTKALIDRFSGDSFTVSFAGEIDPERSARMLELGASINGNEVGFRGTPEALHDLIALIRPNSLLGVQRDEANLTHVFRVLTKGGAA